MTQEALMTTSSMIIQSHYPRQHWLIVHSHTMYSLHMSQVAHQAGPYPGFCGIKRLQCMPPKKRWYALRLTISL